MDLLGLEGNDSQCATIPSNCQCVTGWIPGSTCDYLVPTGHGFGCGGGGVDDTDFSVDRTGGDDVGEVRVKHAGPNSVLVLNGALCTASKASLSKDLTI